MNQSLKCENCLAPLLFEQQRTTIIQCEYCGVENVLGAQLRKASQKMERTFLVKLRNEFDTQFNEEELRLLIFNLSAATGLRLEYDDLAGGSRRMKLLELLKWSSRRRVVPQLVETAVAMRPNLVVLLA